MSYTVIDLEFSSQGHKQSGERVKGGNPAQSLIKQAGTIDLGPLSLIGWGGRILFSSLLPGKSPKGKVCI